MVKKTEKKVKKSPNTQKKYKKRLKKQKKWHKKQNQKKSSKLKNLKWSHTIILIILIAESFGTKKGLIIQPPQDDLNFGHNTQLRLERGMTWTDEMKISLKCTDWSISGHRGLAGLRLNGDKVIWGTQSSWLSNLQRNRIIKSRNGNGKSCNILKVYHWNKGNAWWESKIPEIESLLFLKSPDLIFISEANLREEISDHMKVIDGYQTIYPRTSVFYGYSRLILLIRDNIEFEKLENLMSIVEPSIWVKIRVKGRSPIVIGGNYREHRLLLQQQPNVTNTPALQASRWEKTVEGWSAAAKFERCFFLGDLNLDYSRWQTPEAGHARMVERVKTSIETQGFYQVITGMTRFWPGQPPSQVDHCWTNSPGLVMSHSNETWSVSDHNLIGVFIRTKNRVEKNQEIQGRDWKAMNVKSYIDSVKNIDWENFYEIKDVNILNSMFIEKLKNILDKEAPMKVRQIRRNYASWMDNELQHLRLSRDIARDLAVCTTEEVDWKTYRRIRNQYNKELLKSKDNFYRKQFKLYEHEKDVKSIYKETKKLLKLKTAGPPTKFLLNGTLYQKPIDLARIQIDFFTNKITGLMNTLTNHPTPPRDSLDYIQAAMDRWRNKDLVQEFNFREITTDETVKLISKLGNTTACGLDQVDAHSIKLAASHLILPIKHIVNTSLSESKFANHWKISKTIPILKSKELDKMRPESYRPIALLSTLSKIVERSAQIQLLGHLESSDQLNPNSHAYRQGLSTTTALIQLTDGIYTAAENKQISSLMATDQSAAFDCVRHTLLLKKLKMYKVGDRTLKWFEDYLSFRSHYVSVGRAVSNMQAVSRGVPQGSVLGPLLYSVYTNDISESIRETGCTELAHQDSQTLFGNDCEKCGVLIIYADDSTYRISNKFRTDNQEKLKCKLESIKNYLNANDLVINMDKTILTECMLKQKRGRIGGTPPHQDVVDKTGNPKTVNDKQFCKILGGTIQNDLTWLGHLEKAEKAILPQIRRNLGMMKSLGRKLPLECRNTLARGLITSKLTYLISLWGGLLQTTPKKLKLYSIMQQGGHQAAPEEQGLMN